MKRVLYIGNRTSCLKALQDKTKYEIVIILAGENTRLAKHADVVFSIEDKETIFNMLNALDYDILVSNGCPFILPASELISQGKLLLNTHPTYLPYLRGATPLNGVIYNNYGFLGATTHYISDKVDAGNIIYQEKIDRTEDIDLGLVYEISFTMEEVVFSKAMSILEEHGYDYSGYPVDINKGCYFNRTLAKRTIDVYTEDVDTCLRKVKSFGLRTQGALAIISGEQYKFISAERIVNPFLIRLYKDYSVGDICLKYDDNIVLKLCDGLIKITKYEKIQNIEQ